MLVDAGLPGSESKVVDLLHKLKRDDLKLIFISHAHLDHYGSAAALRRLTGAKIAIHHADENAMAHGKTILGSVHGRGRLVKSILSLMETYFKPEPTPADILLKDGDILGINELEGNVLHTPGHTSGSVSFLDSNGHLFNGCNVYYGAVFLPLFEEMKDYIDNLSYLYTYLENLEVKLYPGHEDYAIDKEVIPEFLEELQRVLPDRFTITSLEENDWELDYFHNSWVKKGEKFTFVLPNL